MTNLVLTRPLGGGGGGNAFETIITDSGTVLALVPNDVLSIIGGNAIVTSAITSPTSISIAVDPSQINLGDLGDVSLGSPIGDGYNLIFRIIGSPSIGQWVAEPATTTDEFVKISGTDTTTGHLSNKIVAGTGIETNILNASGDEDLEISLANGLQLSIINGQPMFTFVDETRGSPGKRLSVAEQAITFSENQLNNNDWLEIGNAVDATSGYIADFTGTVTFATAHCSETGNNSKNIHLYINGIDQGSIGTLTGGTDASFINTTIDLDFVQGDKIRLQAQQGNGGIIQDTVVKLTLKWRS